MAKEVVVSTLGVVLIASVLVALGDYHGYQGPVALEVSRNPVVRQQDAEAAQTNKLSWAEQLNKARSMVQKPSKHMLAVQRRHKVEELVAKRQKAIAARLAHLDSTLQGKKAAAKAIMQGAEHKPKSKAFRPVHLFGGRFTKQEARREHKRSANQELSHLSKLNDEIFGAVAPKPAWKVQTASQELASFGKLNKEVVGSKRYARPLAADTAAKELAQDASINSKVFARSKKAVAFKKGDSAAAELQHLKAVDDAVVPHEDMSSGYAAKGVLSPSQVKKAWARSHPTLAAKGAKAARKAVGFEEKKV